MEWEGSARVLDVSGLEAPEPMVRALAALRELPRGSWLVLQHRRVPIPLLAMLDEMGLRHRTRPGTATDVEVLIWHDGDPEP